MIQLTIIGIYLVLLLSLGLFSHRLFRGTSEDYMLASHSIGPFLLPEVERRIDHLGEVTAARAKGLQRSGLDQRVQQAATDSLQITPNYRRHDETWFADLKPSD